MYSRFKTALNTKGSFRKYLGYFKGVYIFTKIILNTFEYYLRLNKYIVPQKPINR